MHAFLLVCTELTLKTLLNALHPVRSSWYNIGLQLDIEFTELDNFKKMSNPMLEMLKHWLKTAVYPRPTWEAVVKALRSPSVKEIDLATQLECNCCAPEQHNMGEDREGIT